MSDIISNIRLVQNIKQFFSSPEIIQVIDKIIYFIIILIAVWLFFIILLRVIKLIRHLKEPSVFLEITPPADTKVSALSTARYFDSIYNLLDQMSWKDRLLQRQFFFSFEIISDRKNGIRYIARIPRALASLFEKNLRAYLPEVNILQIDDYVNDNHRDARILEFKQKKHFALPIEENNEDKGSDPIDYLISNINRLANDETMAVQMTIKPLSGGGLARQAGRIRKVLQCNKYIEWSKYLPAYRFASAFVVAIEFLTRIFMIPFLFIAEFITGDNPDLPQFSSKSEDVSPSDMEFSELAKNKLKQNLFETSLRAYIVSDKNEAKGKIKGLVSSFANFKHASGQSIVRKKNFIGKILSGYMLWVYKKRLSGQMVLTASEAGSLYHFPLENSVFNEDLGRQRSRKLPAPLSLKSDEKFDLILGENDYLENSKLGVSLEQRRKHIYVIGKTGTGKTTLLKSAIYQDMESGKGLAVFDPHGDMFHELLGLVPKHRIDDVVVFDPSDRAWPVGLNILSPGVDFEDEEDREEWITSSVLAIFAKMTAKEYWGPRMEHILRNTVLTALKTENPSLFTLQRLLTDKSFQKKTANSLDDPVLKQFWNKEFALLGKMQLSNVTAPLTQRLGHFITTKMSRHILLQEKTTLNISKIMDEGKILLVNLAKGDLGEDQSFFFGTILTSIIWMAAYQRTKVTEDKRRDFFLYVDEFQNFATPRFSEITSEGRKFRIGLIASHQNIAQVEDQSILKVVAGNANTIICLKASPDEEKFILPFMEPEVKKGDIVNLAPYHFYVKVSNDRSENAFSGVTLPLKSKPSSYTEEEVMGASRAKYSIPREEVNKYLEEIFSTGNNHKKKKSNQESLMDFPVTGRDRYKRKSI